MIDIMYLEDGKDLGTADTQTSRAANILSIQLGSLEYWPQGGIDLDYFLSESFQFQVESFKAYLIETLANNGINVASVVQADQALLTQFIFDLAPEENSTGLIAR